MEFRPKSYALGAEVLSIDPGKDNQRLRVRRWESSSQLTLGPENPGKS
jgi:hypothetical protein